jgi:hypothetical protein
VFKDFVATGLPYYSPSIFFKQFYKVPCFHVSNVANLLLKVQNF